MCRAQQMHRGPLFEHVSLFIIVVPPDIYDAPLHVLSKDSCKKKASDVGK